MALHRCDCVQGAVHGAFNRERPSILTIDPGDTIVYRTLDAGWGHSGRQRGFPEPELERHPQHDQGHALNGPVAVRGAQPGDVLAVHIERVQPGPWGYTWAGPRASLPRYDL